MRFLRSEKKQTKVQKIFFSDLKITYFLKQKKVNFTEKTVHLGGGPWKHFSGQKIKVPYPNAQSIIFFVFYDKYTIRILRVPGRRLSLWKGFLNFVIFLEIDWDQKKAVGKFILSSHWFINLIIKLVSKLKWDLIKF